MNLQGDITELRSRVAEEYAVDESDLNLTEMEAADYLYDAEVDVLTDLDNGVLQGSGADTSFPTDLAAADTNKDLPSDFLRITGVSVQGWTANGYAAEARIIPYDEYLKNRGTPTLRPSFHRPVASIFGGKVYFSPAASATVTGGLVVRYIKLPTRRRKRFRGAVTSKTSNLIFADLKAAALGFPDDYFNTCQLRFTRGTSRGQQLTVNDYTGSTGTFTFITTAFDLVTSGDEYEVGEAATLNDAFRTVVFERATYLAMLKDRDDLAQVHAAEYRRLIARLNGKEAEVSAR